MKNLFQNKALVCILAVLLAIGMSPTAFAKRATANIKIEKTNVKLTVGETVLLAVDYTELEDLDGTDAVDIGRARIYVDKYEVCDADFGSGGVDLETIEITGLADGETDVMLKVGRFYSNIKVTVGKGAQSPEKTKRDAERAKESENAIANDKSELGESLEAAIKKSTKKEVIVTTNSAKTPVITPVTMKGLAARAQQAKKNVFVQVNSLNSDGKIQAQMIVNPEGLTNIKTDFKTNITVDTSRKASLGAKYIASVKCGHTGSFGMFTEIAVKVNAPKDVSNLILYNVDSNGKLIKIEEPSCFLDKNGLLHFFTKQGGEIVIVNS